MAEKESKFSAREVEVMAQVMQCLKTGIPTGSDIDVPKLAAALGQTEGSASTTWHRIRKKLVSDNDGGAPKTPEDTKAKKASATKRKSTGGQKGEDGEDVDENKDEVRETPSKKPRGRPAKAKAKAPDGDDEENGTEAPATTPAKKKAASTRKTKVKVSSLKTPEAVTDETVHENEEKVPATTTLESLKEKVEVETANGDTEFTVIEKGESEESHTS